MRLLYVHYGPQSGVTASLSSALAAQGAQVLHANPLERFLWQLRPGSRLPNPRPAAVRALVEALVRHRGAWRSGYLHSTFAFDHLSSLVGQAVRAARADAVLQAGALFGPGPYPAAPYHLYLDHTRAIAERYPPQDGLPPPFGFDPAWRARERAVYRNAAGIFTMSAFVMRSLVEDYGVDPDRVTVAGAGPNVVPDGPPVAREKAILFVGRNFVPKGGPELLVAFQQLRLAHPDLRLWLVTARPPPRLPDGAEFLGPQDRDGLARLYARASVFALPTLREAFGLSFVEAMGFGLPVVGTAIEAIPEIVSDGESGLLVPPRDPGALARAIDQILSDPARARLMGAAGRARVAERYGWARTARTVLEALRPRAAGARASPAQAHAG